ncbi:MAG: ATP-binding cassette domain-containing protein [Burkholderiaceae bacterium]|nr:ATP-binding cassette domain-containing protein [Burkholderiaceae bacterium]
MSFEIELRKTLVSDGREFRLDVQFKTDASRVVVIGPSGAGKSLMLQAMAGLLDLEFGRVRVDAQWLQDSTRGLNLPSRQRRLGFVFQDYALFPHLNVRQNIAFGLRQGWLNPRRLVASSASSEMEAVVERSLQRFELTEVAGLLPQALSGGQRQRTALARALASEPGALLLDEPFSALDPALRERMRDELAALLERLQLPMLMITHDAEDVRRFAQQSFELAQGRVQR